MKNISIVDYIKTNLSGKLCNVLELGPGNMDEALCIATKVSGEYFAIDKNKTDKKLTPEITFINTDYFNIAEIDKILHDKKFDLIFSNYSISFNKKSSIIESMPYYFNKLTENGIFYIGDFTKDEQVVKKRTNLDDDWFFNMIRKYFNSYDISKQNVYEKEHGHNHSIFELVAHK